MRTMDRVLAQLIERTEGRMDRTVHVHRHIIQPLGLPEREVAASVAALREGGLIEADPSLPSLIRLTARMEAARRFTQDVREPAASSPLTGEIAAD